MKKVIVSNPLSDREWAERLVKSILDKGVDLTAVYADWVRVGFVFVNHFGADGERMFMDVSSLYAGYDAERCRKKYQELLNGTERPDDAKVNLGTLVNMAKAAGVSIPAKSERQLVDVAVAAGKDAVAVDDASDSFTDDEMIVEVSEESLGKMPRMIKEVVRRFDKGVEKSMMALGAIVTLSVALMKVEGVYDKSRVFPNLYMMAVGSASSGKGRLNLLRHLIGMIHKERRLLYDEQLKDYRQRKREYQMDKGGKGDEPVEPGPKMLIAPANSSSAAINEYISYNEDGLIILETEGDTVANAFKSDFGDYSVILRKAFHHEFDSLGRKTNREYRETENPKVSIVIAGTPGQAARVFPSAENGLLSRFIFFYLPQDLEWRDVWSESEEEPLEVTFKRIGDDVYAMYKELKSSMLPIVFDLTREQKSAATVYFKRVLKEYYFLYGEEMISPLHRLGLIQFRIAMVLSVLRYMESKEPLPAVVDKLGQASGMKLVCQDVDFQLAMELTDLALHHAARVFQMLPKEVVTQRGRMEERTRLMLEKLPKEFKTADAIKIGDGLTISESSVKRFLAKMEREGKIVKGATTGRWEKR